MFYPFLKKRLFPFHFFNLDLPKKRKKKKFFNWDLDYTTNKKKVMNLQKGLLSHGRYSKTNYNQTNPI